jgi:hypothetical protein
MSPRFASCGRAGGPKLDPRCTVRKVRTSAGGSQQARGPRRQLGDGAGGRLGVGEWATDRQGKRSDLVPADPSYPMVGFGRRLPFIAGLMPQRALIEGIDASLFVQRRRGMTGEIGTFPGDLLNCRNPRRDVGFLGRQSWRVWHRCAVGRERPGLSGDRHVILPLPIR